MITELSIENFALIDRISIPFGPGLTVLTGETGAGKSIIVEALSLAIGARGSSEVVRDQSRPARVDVAFEPSPEVIVELEGMGLSGVDGLVLSRTITHDGRSKCWINGRPVTVGILAELGNLLVDYHGQHDHQRLMSVSSHISYVDAYGGESVRGLHDVYLRGWSRMKDLSERLELQRAADSAGLEVRDREESELQELEAAGLIDVGEMERLVEERDRVRNSTSLFESASATLRLLDDDLAGPSAHAQLIDAIRALALGSRLDPQMDGLSQRLSQAADEVGAITGDLRKYLEDLADGKNRQDEIETRLFILEGIVRKFGPHLSDAISLRDALAGRLRSDSGAEAVTQRLEGELAEAINDARVAGEKLTQARMNSAERMCDSIGNFMRDLGLPGASITTSFQTLTIDEAAASGLDRIEFMICLNPGEPSKSLVQSASGGEISRIMLSIKLTLDGNDPVATLVFDEIDTGVGGSTALYLGEMMARLSSAQQVICITHLPQIAAWADEQIVVDKQTKESRTTTTAQTVESDDRPVVLSRMLGSMDGTAGLAHAEEMYRNAQQEKKHALG